MLLIFEKTFTTYMMFFCRGVGQAKLDVIKQVLLSKRTAKSVMGRQQNQQVGRSCWLFCYAKQIVFLFVSYLIKFKVFLSLQGYFQGSAFDTKVSIQIFLIGKSLSCRIWQIITTKYYLFAHTFHTISWNLILLWLCTINSDHQIITLSYSFCQLFC